MFLVTVNLNNMAENTTKNKKGITVNVDVNVKNQWISIYVKYHMES